jgi:acyl carrier protein
MILEKTLINNISKITRIPENELHPDTRIYNSKIVSSLSILEIMKFIETEYNIVIRSEELVGDNFKDVEAIAQFIKRKQNVN